MKNIIKQFTILFLMLVFVACCVSRIVNADIGMSGISSPPFNQSSVSITGGNVTGLTNLGAANAVFTASNTTGVMAANVLNVSGATTIGTEAAGANVTVNATLGSELSPALTGATGSNWTFAGTYTTPLNSTIEKAGAGTDTITPVTQSIVAGTTYKVVITFSAFTAGTASYTLGGVTGSALSAATTYTDYITAATTGKLILTPTDESRFVVSAISVKALTDATGDVINYGNVRSYSQFLGSYSDIYPQYSFMSSPNTGLLYTAKGRLHFYIGGTEKAYFSSSSSLFVLSGTTASLCLNDTYIYRDAADVIGQRNSSTQQTFRLYNTYTNSSNYERLSLSGTAGSSVTLTAETAGTGGDNLDVVLTPAGTGQLKNIAAAVTSGTGTGLTVNHTGVLGQTIYKVTTTYAAYSDSDLTKGVVIATLPAKTRLVAAYADTTVAYAGTDITAATLEVGITAEGAAEILATGNVFAGAILLGDADAEMGTGMTRAAKEQGAYMPSFTGTTAIYATIDATTGAATTLANLTAGSTTFYLITERLP